MRRSTISGLISLLFILLFLYTAISKIMGYAVFKEEIALSPLLAPFSGAIAWGLPKIEIVTAILLAVPHWRLKGMYVSFFLMILFTAYILATLNFSESIPCSCGGLLEQMPWKIHIVFNGGFIILAWVGIRLEKLGRKERRQLWSA
jgi:uncharacterized membrane protein YphA (DoxX/SURF4 family)